MMKRYVLTHYSQAPQGTRRVYDEFMSMTGAHLVPNWLTCMGHNTALTRAHWEMTKGCLLSGELPALLKELVLYVVSRENGAAYCEARHAHAVLELDHSLRYADLVTILEPNSRVKLAPAHRAAINFSARMAWDASAVEDEAFEALLQEGFSHDDIQELVAVIDLAVMFNCYTSALRLPLDAEFELAMQA